MVKKIKYIIPILILFLSLNVSAQNLPTPTSYYYDTSSSSANSVSTSLDLWWGTNANTDYYYHSARIGDFGTSTPRIYRVDFNFPNLNLCSGKELMISGYLGTAGGAMFDEVSYDIQVYNNGSRMVCSFTKIAGNKLQYNCSGTGGGMLAFYFFENSFITTKNYSPGVNRNINVTCDVNNQQILDQSIINSQNIINNQNSNTNAIIGSVSASSQSIINNQNSNTQTITNEISSEDEPDTDDYLEGFSENMASDTPISDLITMPLTLLNAYVNGVSSNCSPYNLGSLLGTNLVLPCINLQERLGSNLWGVIDALFSIFMIYNIAMLFISAFEGFTSLRDDYEGLYQPKHADTGYQPKHGGDS